MTDRLIKTEWSRPAERVDQDRVLSEEEINEMAAQAAERLGIPVIYPWAFVEDEET